MTTRPGQKQAKTNQRQLRDRLLEHFGVLRITIAPEQFDAAIARAERKRLSHLEFLDRLVDGAIILKIKGKSYRAHRAKQTPKPAGK